MSGAGIGPPSDIHLPEDPIPTPTPTRRRFPTIWHLNCIAIITILAASSLITLLDLTVVVLSTLYLLLLTTYSFPPNSQTPSPPIFPNSRLLPLYVSLAGLLGLLLPILYILSSTYSGDHLSVSSASPHLFLLSSQVLMEGLTASFPRFSIPVKAFVPVFYNSWRLPAVAEWARWEMMTSAAERGGSLSMVYLGRALALGNLGLWSFNLFGFLLPVYLPKALRRYYSSSKVE